MQATQQLAQTQQRWDVFFTQKAESDGTQWYNAGPLIYEHMRLPFSGRPDVDFVQHVLATHFAGQTPLPRCLSLGCGSGRLERQLANYNAFVQCDAYDVAPGAIEQAKANAREAGYSHIHYRVADINTMQLPAATYDAVWISASMHHFEQLEHVCQQIAHSLKPGGLLLLDEYVGGNHLQCSERQKELANLCLHLLPERYRRIISPPPTAQAVHNERKSLAWYTSRLRDKLSDGTLWATLKRKLNKRVVSGAPVKQVVTFPTVRDVIAGDPSEAIRSQDIVPVVSQHFDIVQNVGWGGNIVQFLLEHIAGNFAQGDEHAAAYLRTILHIERNAIETGELKPDFAYIVARKK